MVLYGLSTDAWTKNTASMEEALATALAALPSVGVCQSCLAKHMHVALHDVQKAFWALRVTARAGLAADRCGLCDRLRMLVQGQPNQR
jgi:hypothetical protein